MIKRLTSPDWFPRDDVIYTSDSGSMNMHILRVFEIQLNNGVREIAIEKKPFLLTIDGHASRKRIEWLEKCVIISRDAVFAPENTSHFLQPCDKDIKKRINREMRIIRDELNKIAIFDHRTIQFKLMCADIAHERITTEYCVIAFCKTGLFPFNRNVSDRFRPHVVDLCTCDATSAV